MILILCPKCGLFLGVRLHDDHGTAAWCRSCGKPLDSRYLIRAGLPSDLIARSMEWGKRSTEIITGVGAGLDDAEFVKVWKELRDETRTLLESWRRFVETDADVVSEVFHRKPAEAWTDETIVEWRRHQRRVRDLTWFGYSDREPVGRVVRSRALSHRRRLGRGSGSLSMRLQYRRRA